ncbi:TVP38/TMEM64 family protein [Phycicoccus sp. CSK15P-2]|uniref:TVP38/TMEM64 family protein n=1 Tax=Phycicoccus sp. CSK15P-2 TaxID=2807627 RepID=UPI00194F6F63|nr:TVP38/TMEM64 family protein [Phycicoccus sp. CSK15P-2]MBM6406123.1 TVP38/TMEM64 family protein [Phycicoccus sp. CSK15P-2]
MTTSETSSPEVARRLRVLGVVFTLLLVMGVVLTFLSGELTTVRRVVAESGAWGPVVYVGLHAVLTLLPVPKNLLAGIAGAVFGLATGVVWSWSGSMLSALLGFVVARNLGHDTVATLTGPRVERVRRILRDEGLFAVLVARLTPFVPFTIINYAAGVSPVSRRVFVLGTAVGVVPGTVAYVAIGASAGGNVTTAVLAGAAGLVLLALTFVATRLLRRG